MKTFCTNLVQRNSASMTLIQLTGGANSSSRIMSQVLLSPRGYFSWLCLHPPACVLKLTFGGEIGALLSSSWPPLLVSTWQHERHVTCRLNCNASNLRIYGQSWNETSMLVFRILCGVFPESYTCTMTVTLAMAANWKKSVHSSTIKVCFRIMHNSDHNGYHVVRIFIHLY